MRMFMTFDTGAERYAWLAGPNEIEYEIYTVQ